MGDPKSDVKRAQAARARKLLQMRGTGDVYRRAAVERKLKQLPHHVVQRAHAHVTRVDVSEEEGEEITVTTLNIGKGTSPEHYIEKQVATLKDAVSSYWNNYQAGLDNFQTDMTFASRDEAESHYLTTALKAVAKADLDVFLEALSKGCEELAPPITVAKELITAELEEHERVEKAEGERTIADFIVHLRTQIGRWRKHDMDVLDQMVKDMTAEYEKVAGSTGSAEGRLVGAGATMLQNLHVSVEDAKTGLDAKTIEVLQEQITEVFAKTGPSRVGPITAGLHENATLYLDCGVSGSDGKWELDDSDDSWTLMTNAPEPDKVVTSLLTALEEQGKTIVQSHLRKVVKATFNNYDDVLYKFVDIDDVEWDISDVVLHGNDPKEAEEAWSAVIKAKLLATHEVHGKNG